MKAVTADILPELLDDWEQSSNRERVADVLLVSPALRVTEFIEALFEAYEPGTAREELKQLREMLVRRLDRVFDSYEPKPRRRMKGGAK